MASERPFCYFEGGWGWRVIMEWVYFSSTAMRMIVGLAKTLYCGWEQGGWLVTQQSNGSRLLLLLCRQGEMLKIISIYLSIYINIYRSRYLHTPSSSTKVEWLHHNVCHFSTSNHFSTVKKKKGFMTIHWNEHYIKISINYETCPLDKISLCQNFWLAQHASSIFFPQKPAQQSQAFDLHLFFCCTKSKGWKERATDSSAHRWQLTSNLVPWRHSIYILALKRLIGIGLVG